VVYSAYLDASALAKRYVPEPGSPVVDHLFLRVPVGRMIVLSVGLAEVVSILARKRNARVISPAEFHQILGEFRSEIGLLTPVQIIAATADLADQSFDLIDRHSINSTDAILLRSALDLATALRGRGDDLFLAASDQRLLKAAQAERLATFNPETQSAAELDALLGP
jgi:predicted nucleic acid-binding protein